MEALFPHVLTENYTKRIFSFSFLYSFILTYFLSTLILSFLFLTFTLTMSLFFSGKQINCSIVKHLG